MDERDELFIELDEKIQDLDRYLAGFDSLDLANVKNEFLRFLHNVKGSCSMIDETPLAEFSHQVEDLLQEHEFTKTTENILLKTINQIEAYINGYGDNPLDLQEIKNYISPKKDVERKQTEKAIEVFKEKGQGIVGVLKKLKTNLRFASIDDEPEITQSIARKFQRYGIEVEQFQDGNSFFQRGNLNDFHLVITDKNLPGLDGIEIIKKIRAEDPLLPIIFLSGYLSEEVMFESAQLGVSTIIPKPFKLDMLAHQGINIALRHLSTELLRDSLKKINFMMGAIDFENKLKDSEVIELKKQIQSINLELLRIKKYFANLT